SEIVNWPLLAGFSAAVGLVAAMLAVAASLSRIVAVALASVIVTAGWLALLIVPVSVSLPSRSVSSATITVVVPVAAPFGTETTVSICSVKSLPASAVASAVLNAAVTGA